MIMTFGKIPAVIKNIKHYKLPYTSLASINDSCNNGRMFILRINNKSNGAMFVLNMFLFLEDVQILINLLYVFQRLDSMYVEESEKWVL